MSLNIFFDVDYTIIGYDGSLRPFVKEVFAALYGAGHNVYVWSGMGIRWEVVDRHGLRPYIVGCYAKPLKDHHNGLQTLGVPVMPDFCVDDYQEIIDAFGGIRVRAYEFADHRDREMQKVFRAIEAVAGPIAPSDEEFDLFGQGSPVPR